MEYLVRKELDGQTFDSNFIEIVDFKISNETCVFEKLSYIDEKIATDMKVKVQGKFDSFMTIAQIEDHLKALYQLNKNLSAAEIILECIQWIDKSQKISDVTVTLSEKENFNEQTVKFIRMKKGYSFSLEVTQDTGTHDKCCTFITEPNRKKYLYYRENDVKIHKIGQDVLVETIGFAEYRTVAKAMENFDEIIKNI